jgi:hypothetical protein
VPATAAQIAALEADPLTWRATLFEKYLTDTQGRLVPDAPHHRRYWTWLWSIERGKRSPAFVGIWARGGAKSTNAELGTIAVGARRARRYAWYVSDTQDQADDHVETIGQMLESRQVATFYPDLAARRVGKYGSSRGWRRNRLRTRSGFTVDAIGLDRASRGVKDEEVRPDFFILDDIDDQDDTAAATEKKINTLTKTIIQAGSEDRAITAIQNLVKPGGVFDQLATGDADYLANRILSGPIPAIEDLTYETRITDEGPRIEITGGTPTWIGQDLARCQDDMNEVGITAWLQEAQHEVADPPGGMFDHIDLASLRRQPEHIPPLTRVVCWVDPAVTKTDQSDAHAIHVAGIDGDRETGTIWDLWSWEQRATPLASLKTAIREGARWGANYVGVETDQGGDTWKVVFRTAKKRAVEEAEAAGDTDLAARIRHLAFKEAKAGQGDQPKAHRASMMLADYERPGWTILHAIGTHTLLERALKRFPKTKPLDLVDAKYWAWDDLRNGHEVAAGGGDDPDDEPDEDDDPYAAARSSRLWA